MKRAVCVLALACACACALGCDDDGDLRGPIEPEGSVGLPTDAAAPSDGSASCPSDLFVTSAEGCRAQWSCAGAENRSLICLAEPSAGVSCACVRNAGELSEDEEDAVSETGEDAGPTPTGAADSCNTATEAAAIAQRVCGWSVEE